LKDRHDLLQIDVKQKGPAQNAGPSSMRMNARIALHH